MLRILRSGGPGDWRKVLAFILVWGTAVIILLSYVTVSSTPPTPIWSRPGYTLHHGYTISLVLLILPLLALAWWYMASLKADDGRLRSLVHAAAKDAALAGLVFVIFDILFARLLFHFPDAKAVTGINLPGFTWSCECSTVWQFVRWSCYARNIPIEEALFYLGGAAVLRGMYIWASEDFLHSYSIPHAEYCVDARNAKPLVSVNFRLLLLAVAIVLLGFYAKARHGGGIPTYLILETLIIFLPLVALYDRVHPFMNTRAFLMTMVLQILVSLIWEVTLALPYGWWHYLPSGMVGAYVEPWSDIPIEACLFWLAVGWSAMFLHETTKLKVRSGKGWRHLLFGPRPGSSASTA